MLSLVDTFARYVASLTGSWRALAAPHPRAAVTTGDGFVASRHPRPVLNNAILLDPCRLIDVVKIFEGAETFAVWSLDRDDAVAASLEAGSFRRDITTRPMVCQLADIPSAAATDDVAVLRDVDPRVIASLNDVPADLVLDVSGLRAYATEDHQSGLVIIAVDDDVNVSFVSTQRRSRRRGLAGAVMRAALVDARDAGFTTASLQATPMAEPMYARIGFEPVGRWQEWAPA